MPFVYRCQCAIHQPIPHSGGRYSNPNPSYAILDRAVAARTGVTIQLEDIEGYSPMLQGQHEGAA